MTSGEPFSGADSASGESVEIEIDIDEGTIQIGNARIGYLECSVNLCGLGYGDEPANWARAFAAILTKQGVNATAKVIPMAARRNVLIDHVLDTPRPSPGETWCLRKGWRSIRIVAVDAQGVDAESTETGRKSRLQLDTFVSTYVKVPPHEPFSELRAAALLAFVETIEATGGVVYDGRNHGPCGNEDWIDLGAAYLKACHALGREPKVTRLDGMR